MDLNPKPSTASPFTQVVFALAERTLGKLVRHRERYLKAWIAATGSDPRECVLEEHAIPGSPGIGYKVRVVRAERVPDLYPTEVRAVALAAHRLRKLASEVPRRERDNHEWDRDTASRMDEITLLRGFPKCSVKDCSHVAITRLGYCSEHG